MSGIYDVTLANNAAGNIAALGSFVKVYSAPAGAIQLKLDGGEAYSLLEGQGVRLPDGHLFRDVQVVNKAGASQTVRVFVGDSRFEDTRITGVVSIVDSSKARTLANQAFMGRMSVTGANPQYPLVQLGVPGGASVRAVVETISAQCSAAGNLYVVLRSTAATVYAHGTSKLSGGAQSVAELQADIPAVIAPVIAANILTQIANAANVALTVTFREPVVVLPGYQLCVVSDQFNIVTLAGVFEFVEEPNT